MISLPALRRSLPAPLAAVLLWLALPAPALKAAEATAGGATPAKVSFNRQIRPIFQAQCQGCHQPAKAKGEYVMTEFTRLLKPGKSGEAPVVAGKPEGSHLLAQITPKNGEADMPKGKPPLNEREIELVRRWIAEGAADDTPPNANRPFDADHPPVYSQPPVVTAMDFSPDGSLIAVSGFHEVLLHRADGNGLVARLIGLAERIQSVRFSPDGKLLAVAGGQPARMGEVQIWDVESRQLKLSVPVGHDTLYGVNWSPDGRLVSFGCPDKTIRAIEAATGNQVLQQMAHEDWVLDTVFSTNGTHVISVGRDMTAKLTEVPTQRFVDNITSITPGALRGGLASVARHPFRDEVLVGGADGRPQIYQVFRQAARKIGDNATLLRKFPEMDGRIFSVDYSPDGKSVAAAASLDGRGSVALYAAEFDPTIPELLLKAYQKTSGEYSQAERDAIEQFTTAGVKLLHKFPVPSGATVYATAFSPDGRHVAVGTSSGLVLLFNTVDGSADLVFAVIPPSDGSESGSGNAASSLATLADSSEASGSTPEPKPDPMTVASLVLEPASLTLANRSEHLQVLVHARLSSGDIVDVTRFATFEVEGGLGQVSGRGRFTALKAGKGSLKASYGARSATAGIDLEKFDPTFAADFIQDVNPLLGKLGCNAGTCHGAKDGKNGFKLSLRGYDPIYDIRGLTDDIAARRINLAAPDQSLMLLKGTGAVAHEGGARTPVDSEYYAILRRWIAGGARLDTTSARVTKIDIHPANPVVQSIGARQQMRVVATYANGRVRDVTAEAVVETGNGDVAGVEAGGLVTTLRRGEAPILARYEGAYAATTVTVMGDRKGFAWKDQPANNRIDELVAAKWQRMKILPSEVASDAAFMRRAALDLTGLPPTSEEVREFLANPRDSRSKRDALIERLLNSQAFVDHWANKWADLLQVNRKFLGEEGAKKFRDWIRSEIAANTPYDEFVRKLLTATGSNKDNPAAAYWKILRTPTEAMETTTHLFLATRFNCNKCHDHPFERWTQDQYYHLSQYFAQVELKKDDASGDRRIGGTAVEGATPLFEVVSDRTQGSVKHDRTGKEVAPGFPFPASPAKPSSPEAAPGASRRAELAAWLTSPDNRYFALSYVNRLWGYLLGVGLVEPLDDIRAGNPPSNPELLDHLTREFVESGFNTRHILRQICQSRTYQLALETQTWNDDDKVNFSHALPRRLPAEVLYDSVHQVTGSQPRFPGAAPGTRASQLLDAAVDVPSGFLANLGRPPRESACECERSNDLKLSSVLSLLSGPAVSEAINDPASSLARLAASEKDDRKLANEIFLRVLNRPARETELNLLGKTAADLEQEHARLTETLLRAEAAWNEKRPQLERDRSLSIERAEKALAYHLIDRGPKQAAALRDRHERIATAETAIRDQEPWIDIAASAWEAGLARQHFATRWIPLEVKSVQATGSATARKLPDGTIRSTVSGGELPNYVVTAETKLVGITGLKLEVLPDAELPNYGPGHAPNGEFVLGEFITDTASKTNADKFARAKIKAGATDRIAPGYQIEQLFNGVIEQGRAEGWRLGGDFGEPHWATFAFEQPVGDTNGTVLKISLIHAYEAPHELGRFRLWVTTSPTPTDEGLPEGLGDVLRVPASRRTPQQAETIKAHVRSHELGALRREFALTLARRPLPEDLRRIELEQDLERASRPVAIDVPLALLRQDVEQSSRQLTQKRLTAVQDLTWALINTPSFLFNR